MNFAVSVSIWFSCGTAKTAKWKGVLTKSGRYRYRFSLSLLSLKTVHSTDYPARRLVEQGEC